MALARLRRGGREDTKSALFIKCYNVFAFPTHLAFELIHLELGGAHGGPVNDEVRQTTIFVVFGRRLKPKPLFSSSEPTTGR